MRRLMFVYAKKCFAQLTEYHEKKFADGEEWEPCLFIGPNRWLQLKKEQLELLVNTAILLRGDINHPSFLSRQE